MRLRMLSQRPLLLMYFVLNPGHVCCPVQPSWEFRCVELWVGLLAGRTVTRGRRRERLDRAWTLTTKKPVSRTCLFLLQLAQPASKPRRETSPRQASWNPSVVTRGRVLSVWLVLSSQQYDCKKLQKEMSNSLVYTIWNTKVGLSQTKIFLW